MGLQYITEKLVYTIQYMRFCFFLFIFVNLFIFLSYIVLINRVCIIIVDSIYTYCSKQFHLTCASAASEEVRWKKGFTKFMKPICIHCPSLADILNIVTMWVHWFQSSMTKWKHCWKYHPWMPLCQSPSNLPIHFPLYLLPQAPATSFVWRISCIRTTLT